MFVKNSNEYTEFLENLIQLKHDVAHTSVDKVPGLFHSFMDKWKENILRDEKNGKYLIIKLEQTTKYADTILVTSNTSSIPVNSNLYLTRLDHDLCEIIKTNL